ncbi:MAG: hypothetical protein ACRBG0_04165 [Lewinella sp.]|jgi:hypothetical protein|uniref:hypothetical protein n=1 Tax=Lewinella sp. TaxID=2004506 RepID=UPI003D6BD87C
MSTTHFVKLLSDLSIFSRAVPSAPEPIEWVLKMVTLKNGTSKSEVVFEILSNRLTAVNVKYDSVNDGYNVTIDTPSSSLPGARSYHEFTSKDVSISFAENANKHARFIVVDDLSIMLECILEGPTINDHVIVLNIESTSVPDEYFYSIWCYELNLL